MSESFYKTFLRDGRAKKLQELVDLASEDRSPGERKKFAEKAKTLLNEFNELDEKLAVSDGPGGLDYREDAEINVPIIRFLTQIGRPASEGEITKDLIRGQFRGYKDERKMAIRVGRCVRSYTLGKPSENPKLKVKHNLVGLTEWPDKMFQG